MIKAELWDKMQHIMAKYNDHMMHATISFDKMINFDVLKKALSISIDKVPILKHTFYFGAIEPKWLEIKDFNINNVIELRETTGDVTKESDEFLLQIINEKKEAQIKVLILRKEGKDTLNFLINHMCFDGADFKIYIKLVKDIYNDLSNGGSGDIACKNGSRDELQLFDDMSEEDQKIAKNLLIYNKSAKHPFNFPFSEYSKKKISPKIFKNKIDADTFIKAKARCKEYGCSLNDLFCACYIRGIYSIMEIPAGQTLGVPNIVDLRRYKNNKQTDGFANLVSMMICNLGEDIGNDIFETAKKVTEDLSSKKDNFPGLHGLPNLRRAFKILPYFITHFLIGIFYKNPRFGMSNIGIINENDISFNGLNILDAFMTGSVKLPPYMQIALTTFRNEVTSTIAVYCNENDDKVFNKLLDNYKNEFIIFANGK